MSDIRSNSDIEPCLSVVMPAYNEAATIEKAAAAVLAQRPVQELIIVDDGSQDGTRDILVRMAAAAPRIQLIIQERNQGKGAALRKGFAQASAPYVIVQDADLEYDLLNIICSWRRCLRTAPTLSSVRASRAPRPSACCIIGTPSATSS